MVPGSSSGFLYRLLVSWDSLVSVWDFVTFHVTVSCVTNVPTVVPLDHLCNCQFTSHCAFMMQILPSEADSRFPDFMDLSIHYHVQKSPLLDCVLSQLHPAHLLTVASDPSHLHLGLPKGLFCWGFSIKICIHFDVSWLEFCINISHLCWYQIVLAVQGVLNIMSMWTNSILNLNTAYMLFILLKHEYW